MAHTPYPEAEANPDFPRIENEILDFWKREDVFARSVSQRPRENAYVFYDGPPFANGLPHYGHLLTGFVKDAVARYQTMRGKRVERRFGWDCHGLPAEMGAEKELGISGRAAIQQFGIDKFNAHCRTSVMKYTAEWEYYVNRQGRWVDFQNDYKTMDTPFMESCLWAFKQLYEKGLIYEAMRVMPYSWAAETPVSNFETRLDNATREREDKAAFVKFKLKDVPESIQSSIDSYKRAISSDGQILNRPLKTEEVYLIAWTTTPWTLPSNLALAVSKEVSYRIGIDANGALCIGASSYITAPAFKDFLCYYDEDGSSPSGDETPIARYIDVDVKDIIGLPYEHLFPYFADTPNAFRVLDGSEFVTDGDGTGVVHLAPGFGEVDQQCCEKNGIEVIVPVDGQGKYTDAIFDVAWEIPPTETASAVSAPPQGGSGSILSLRGLNVIADTRLTDEDRARHIAEKDVEKYGLANMRIVRWLKANHKLVKDEPYKHNYPHCWRTDTPLIYRAMSSWYVDVPKIKATMAENNRTIHWIPGHVRDGQMGHMIDTAPGWSISRNRFWGTPIPIWKSAGGKIHVCGSIEEIERLSGQKVTDLHRPFIDEVVLMIDGEEYRRIEDVFDCWFESGSMPFAQLHYPFENKERFEREFPADFITEYIAQTRGWFNTLITLSAALFGKAPFQNVICHGVVIDEETGLKYSKRLKNYKDPKEVMDAYGADALRWMMLSSPVMRGADLAVDPEGKFIRDVVRLNIKPIWNAYSFFTLYANADGILANRQSSVASEDILDCYIMAKCRAAVEQVRASLDAYDTPGACEAVSGFFEVLNNWYIRRSKERFWAEEKTDDKQAAYDTLYTVLVTMCEAAAPLLPFTTEAVYRGLKAGESVHLADFPEMPHSPAFLDQSESETTVLRSSYQFALMDVVRDACTAALSVRSANKIRVRQPLKEMRIVSTKTAGTVGHPKIVALIQDEVNVQEVLWEEDIGRYATPKLQINSAILGKRLPEKMKQILPASKKGEWTQHENGSVEIAGEVLRDGEYTVNLEPKPEYKASAAPLASHNALVVLDLTLTPELIAEGNARDLVRMVQQARKDAGLHVSDRIALTIAMPDALAAAVYSFREYICAQVLADSFTEGEPKAGAYRATQEMEGVSVTIGVSKA